MADFWKPLKEKKYKATIKLSVQIEFFDTNDDSAHDYALEVAECLANYLACARGDYPTEPEIDDVTTKEVSEE